MNRTARRTGVAALAAAGAMALLAARALTGSAAAETFTRVAAPAYDAPAGAGLETAVLSGGCFWGMQGVFEHVKGVRGVVAGYAGGAAASAHYELVSTGVTGHAESIEIRFDPREVSYGEILRIFFSVASDPTQVGGQYPDEGSQYRSEIWAIDAAQRATAERYIAQLNASRAFARPIATRVDAFGGFYRAESYHQDYLVHHPDALYIATYDAPRLKALKALFPDAWRGAPVLTLAAR